MRELVSSHDLWHEAFGSVFLTGKPDRFESEVKGLNRWFDVYAFRLGGPESRKVAILFNDITERKRSEEARCASEERFRHYFELGLIGMAITSPDKGCLEVNDELCRILGYGRSELLQKTWAEMTHPDDLAADAVRRLVDRDAAEVAELLLQIPGAHQPARAAANDCKVEHMCSVKSFGRAAKRPV